MKKKEKYDLYEPFIDSNLIAEFKGYRWNVIPSGRKIKRKKKQ